jgi:hypothetical protein
MSGDSESPQAIRRFLLDSEFQCLVQEEKARQHSLLAEYLGQEGLLSGPKTALVDLGWRASIQASLNRMFAAVQDFKPIPGFYLGLWSEDECRIEPGGLASGIITDLRRKRSLRESAAWHLALLLEALCRAPHGTVIGFRRNGANGVQPILADDTPSRNAEIKGETIREPIRRGILSYIHHYALYHCPAVLDQAAARRKAQLQALRLAFFPRSWEVRTVSQLVHTESHAPNWSAPIVAPDRPNPLMSPRRWLQGLSSPWRAGYVAATGGYPFAFAFLCLEAFLTAAPAGVRQRLRTWAIASGNAG